MKHGKTFFLLTFIFAAVAAFAGEALPAEAADWPAKLGMTPKMLFLVLQIGIIMFAAKIGGSIATALKLPSVLGELGAGILIGPWALGGFAIPGFDGMFQYGIFYGLTYNITLRDATREKEMIDRIRERNGNLEIMMSKQENHTAEL